MNKFSGLFILLFLLFLSVSARGQRDTVYSYLYKLLENKDVYVKSKTNRISQIKNMLETPNVNDQQRYEINHRLHNEYKTFISDSAIYYTTQNLEIARKLKHDIWLNECKLDLVSLYIIAGMYIESLDLLKSIDKGSLPDWLLIKYYDNYKQFYSYYSNNNPYTRGYLDRSNLYRDSLLKVLDKSSNHYKIVYAEKLYDAGRLKDAKEILQSVLQTSAPDTHEKAVLAYALANTYGKEGNTDLQKYYYAVSAICDIKNAIKENASTKAIASVLYENGELEEAYKCIRSSMEDAMFCNARVRTYEVSQIFPIIDSAYKRKIDGKNKTLQLYLLLVSILSLFLIVAIVFVYRQMKRIARIRKELYETNHRLSELNNALHDTNKQLQVVNDELLRTNESLSEANQIKETYIGHFLDLCSTYIDKLEKYQNSLNRKAIERKLDELYRMLKSRDMIDNELKELYENFDNTFLHLYPNFVEEFNSLLVPEEQFVLRSGEVLNVELRIFALIRLGITDSSRIARFLHYSANTIYSYRTRARNKAAVPREEFESMVMKIGSPVRK